jgi:hypothetical protein
MASSTLASLLSPFHGKKDENIHYFLTQFNDISILESWTDTKKLVTLKLFCKDAARQYIMQDPVASKETNVNKLEDLLRNKFGSIESFEEIQQQFSKIMQKPGQSVHNLAEEINIITNKYVGSGSSELQKLQKKMMLTKFLDALRSDIRAEVRKFGCKTYEDAVQCAKNVENALEEQNHDNIDQSYEINNVIKQNIQSQSEITLLKEKIKLLEQQNKILTENSNINNRPSTSNVNNLVQCHICHKSHLTTDCWYYPTNTSRGENRQVFRNSRGRNYGNRNFQNRNYFNRHERTHPYRNRGERNQNLNQ